mmetsp:Transcript_35288/g.58069  ORF Transcript_35288/g.58069 Transcript_35288/m.58069 type:complete len:212 (+) Transcript_35288:444-1079(+)
MTAGRGRGGGVGGRGRRGRGVPLGGAGLPVGGGARRAPPRGRGRGGSGGQGGGQGLEGGPGLPGVLQQVGRLRDLGPHHAAEGVQRQLRLGVGGGGGGGGGLLPPARRADPASERRRARAMKLLDAKFAELAQREGEGAWGDEDGGISATTGQAGKHSEGLVGEDASSSSPPELITGISSTKNADDDEDGENWGLEEEGKHAAKVTPSSSG